MFPFFLALWVCAIVNAATLPVAKVGNSVLEARAGTSTSAVSRSSSSDDVPTVQKAIQKCPSGTIIVPAGTTYNINPAFSFAGCGGCSSRPTAN
jgi:galacturan 1,4-alpha-galacturonidase